MQFAFPPRKTSNPPPYSRPSRSAIQRRKELRTTAVLGCAIISILFLVYYMSASNVPTTVSDVPVSPDKSKVVIVTVLDDETYGSEYIHRVKENREDYAKRHGYTNFFTNVKSYVPYIENHPKSWAIIPAVRNAMTQYPSGTHFFHLSQHAMIMNPSLSLKSEVFDKQRLESIMLKDVPIVPPDSVIKTLSYLKEEDVDLIITQDQDSLVPGSFIMKRSEWSTFLLDAWFDPLYRSYNFKQAEAHALDHIAQWHPTVLSKIALIPQRIMNSYNVLAPTVSKDGTYKEGDFLVHFYGCNMDPKRDCSKEMSPFWSKWQMNKDKEGI